jgi:hypothetical protein
MKKTFWLAGILLSVFGAILVQSVAADDAPPAGRPGRPGYDPVPGVRMSPVQEYLDRGDTAGAVTAMTARLAADPNDDEARFALGTAQFFQAIEHASQAVYAAGLKSNFVKAGASGGPDLSLYDNPKSIVVTYPGVRAAFKTWLDDLAKVDATLSAVKNPNVQMRLRIGTIELDLIGDGHPTDRELLSNLWTGRLGAGAGGAPGAPPRPGTMQPAQQQPGAAPPAAADLYIKFDRGDVYWLQGYCHLLSAVADVALAYDEQAMFDRAAQLFFKKVQTPYPFLAGTRHPFNVEGFNVADAVACVHLMSFPVTDKSKMADAQKHLKAAIQDSRLSWKSILAETGDDHEWIPNPRQTPLFSSMNVKQEMVDRWLAMLDDLEAVIDGKKLIPFWRGDKGDGIGINLDKFFKDPPTFDPFLMIQGSSFGPYLEKGPTVSGKVFNDLEKTFGSQLPQFSFWFN